MRSFKPPYRLSLRARATSWYVGLLAMALVIFSVAVYLGIRSYLYQALRRDLSSSAHTVADDFLAKLPLKGDKWVLGEIRESYESISTERYIRLSLSGKTLYQTADMREPSIQLAALSLPATSSEFHIQYQHFHGRGVIIYSMPFHAQDGRLFEIEAGASLASLQQTLLSLEKILLLATIFTLVVAAFGGYFLMKQPLQPLVVLTRKAANIGTKGLGERLPVIPTGDELERLTHSLNAMIERLEEALDHNYRFSADASHELRTPLTIMRGEMEEMLSIDELPSLAVGNLVSTLEEIERMSRIVSSLMTITRLDAGGERMDLQVINLSALVRTTMEHMRLLAEEKELSLTCVCDENVLVDADPMRLKQVLVNLIDNAIKYTPGPQSEGELPNGRSASTCFAAERAQRDGVEVFVSISESKAILKVKDHGVGISAEALPFVFDRFYRADFARSRGAGGVGLGLAIVKAIVAAHNGSVFISSVAGEGSTVVVQLPLAEFDPLENSEDSQSTVKPSQLQRA